jgi:hypothetical protein
MFTECSFFFTVFVFFSNTPKMTNRDKESGYFPVLARKVCNFENNKIIL